MTHRFRNFLTLFSVSHHSLRLCDLSLQRFESNRISTEKPIHPYIHTEKHFFRSVKWERSMSNPPYCYYYYGFWHILRLHSQFQQKSMEWEIKYPTYLLPSSQLLNLYDKRTICSHISNSSLKVTELC